ncbi:MAG: hypothetical protein AB8G22_27755 [Saprospiraceae bacterium]
MKNCLTFLLTLSFFLTLSLNPLAAQTYVEMDFFKLSADQSTSEYLSVEQDMWKAMHQEKINLGELNSWGLYRVPFPGGSEAEYHYVTVRVYKDLQQAESGTSMGDIFKKVYPDKDMDAAFEKTGKSREWVKTYGFINWEGFWQEERKTPSEVIQHVYFNVDMPKWSAYRDFERKYAMPMHKLEIADKGRDGWAGLQLIRPMGMDMPYQFVAVDFFKDMDQYMNRDRSGKYFKAAFPDMTDAQWDEKFYEVAELARIEEFHLIDFARK